MARSKKDLDIEKATRSTDRAIKLICDFRQPTRALTLLTEAISVLPRSGKLYAARAQVYRTLGRNQLAFCDLNSVLRLEPQMNRAYALRAIVLLRLRRYRDALGDINFALDAEPAARRRRSRVQRARRHRNRRRCRRGLD
jgi:tetratricopeptide (TPR) repeat protein